MFPKMSDPDDTLSSNVTVTRSASRFEAARLFFGFAPLPPLAGVMAFFIHRILWPVGPSTGGQWSDPVDAAVSFAAGTAIVALLVTAAGAAPIVVRLLRRG